jgi:hypothetical protein
VAEALIGAAYLSAPEGCDRVEKIDRAIKGMKLLGIPLDGLESWSNIAGDGSDTAQATKTLAKGSPVQSSIINHPVHGTQPAWMKAFQPRDPPITLLGYTFKDRSRALDVLVSYYVPVVEPS